MADEYTIKGTVLDDSPLTVIVPGADTSCPATKGWWVDAVAVGDLVTLLVRTPQPPRVQGIEDRP